MKNKNPKLLIGILLIFSFQTVNAQNQSSEHCGCLPAGDSPALQKTSDSLNSKKTTIRLDLIKSFNDTSATYLGWCLLIIGGTILTIINTDYRFPARKGIRLTYLLFLPGWLFLSLTINNCMAVSENYLGAKSYGINDCLQMCYMVEDTRKLFDKMTTQFGIGLLILVLWLVIMLLVWVFGGNTSFVNKS